MTRRMLSRRIFLVDLGKGGVAAAVGIGLIACGGDDDPTATATAAGAAASGESTPTVTPTLNPTVAAGGGSGGASATAAATTDAGAASGSGLVAVEWERANLGSVSAYVLARGNEATIVDTGVPNSEDGIEAALAALGLSWDSVAHVIVTHLHGDHAGSLPAVLNAAAGATAYAGAADIAGISSPRELVAVGDGDRVFDLEIVETPGHTAGHISVYDRVGGIFVAGDAINGADGGVVGPNSRFTPDMDLANQSVVKIAGLEFDTILFGHGEPVLSGGSAGVIELMT